LDESWYREYQKLWGLKDGVDDEEVIEVEIIDVDAEEW
jgi:hypothetical protein